MNIFNKNIIRSTAAALVLAAGLASAGTSWAQELPLRYGHMNAPVSLAGLQADWLAKAIKEKTGGAITI